MPDDEASQPSAEREPEPPRPARVPRRGDRRVRGGHKGDGPEDDGRKADGRADDGPSRGLPLTAKLTRLLRAGLAEISLEEETPAEASFSSDALARLAGRAVAYGRYRLKGQIAAGGQGAVLRVWDEDLRRHLAMKVLLSGTEGKGSPVPGTPAADEKALARFLEEAQVTSQLDHPGIVPVHELGLDDRGGVYFTMKLVRGRDFHQILKKVVNGEDGWSRTRALGVLVKVGEAMAYAHAKGVIHRDLKPGNVMVGRFGEAYVMDWGLARVIGPDDGSRVFSGWRTTHITSDRRDHVAAKGSPLITASGVVLGTPTYMAPEQASGNSRAVGPRTDIYSLGAMLYELLTGYMPYHGPGKHLSPRTIYQLLLVGPPRQVHELAPDVPPELAAICDKAMAREPADRYGSMEALADDLRAYLERRVVRAYETGAVAELRKWVKRNRLVASLTFLLLLAIVGGSFGWVRVQTLAEQRRLARDVDGVLNRVAELRSARDFESALMACQTAEAMLDGSRADPALVDRITAARMEIEGARQAAAAEAERSARVARFLGELDEITSAPNWLEGRNPGYSYIRSMLSETSEDLQAVFGAYGVDPFAMDGSQVLELLQETGEPEAVALAMDEWARIVRHLDGWQSERARQLLTMASVLDRDPRRGDMRAALLEEDRRALEELCASDETATWPPETVAMLVLALHDIGSGLDVVPMLRECQLRHPGDPVINQVLAARLEWQRPRPEVDIIRFLAAAQAARPDNWTVSRRLSEALARAGRMDEALAAFTSGVHRGLAAPGMITTHLREFRELFHDSRQDAVTRAVLDAAVEQTATDVIERNDLAWALLVHPDAARRDPERALALARDVLDEYPEAGAFWNTLGVALLRLERWREAIDALRKGIRLSQRVYESDLIGMTLALEGLGRPAQALEWHERAEEFRRSRPDEVFDWELADLRAATVRRFGESGP